MNILTFLLSILLQSQEFFSERYHTAANLLHSYVRTYLQLQFLHNCDCSFYVITGIIMRNNDAITAQLRNITRNNDVITFTLH